MTIIQRDYNGARKFLLPNHAAVLMMSMYIIFGAQYALLDNANECLYYCFIYYNGMTIQRLLLLLIKMFTANYVT